MRFKLKTLSEVRERALKGEEFSITYCTYDEARGTGGDRATIQRCKLVKLPDDRKAKAPATAQPVRVQATEEKKTPWHLVNGTYNVTDLSSGRMKKVHWLLIELFNGFQVVM